MFKYKTLKKMIFISIILLMMVFSLSSCLVTDKTLTEKNNGDSLNLKINDTVEIKLESNPTTGYSWFLSDNIDETIVSVTGPEFRESKKDEELIGAGGFEIFTIKAIAKSKTDIILNYQRPWEEDVGSNSLKIHLDAFHMNIEEKDSGEAIRKAGKLLYNFHANENDCGAPGTGQIHWDIIAKALKDIKYDRYLVIESFTPDIELIARAASIWRETEKSAWILAEKGLTFLKGIF